MLLYEYVRFLSTRPGKALKSLKALKSTRRESVIRGFLFVNNKDKKSAQPEFLPATADATYVMGAGKFPLPENLFIPPDALEIFLQEFSGPLDILLFLIRKRNMDIEAVNIADVANQYLEYIRLMKQFKMDLAAEYLVMASVLVEIKSRSLLVADLEDDEEGAMSAELLAEKIRAYEVIQQASLSLSQMPRLDRDLFVPYLPVALSKSPSPVKAPKTVLDPRKLAKSLANVLKRKSVKRPYEVRLEELSTRERMALILDKLSLAGQLNTKDGHGYGHGNGYVPFAAFWTLKEKKAGAVVSFTALMQLIKEGLADIRQEALYAPIYVRACSAADPSANTESAAN